LKLCLKYIEIQFLLFLHFEYNKIRRFKKSVVGYIVKTILKNKYLLNIKRFYLSKGSILSESLILPIIEIRKEI
jgi:hypothetical protein